MTIDIITLHCPLNCGSVLQGYALCHYLGKYYNTENVQLIDYVPSYMENEGHPVRTILRKVLFYRQYKNRNKNFKDFIDNNCNLTRERYHTYQKLKENPPKADIYISGSDQLWNPCFNCGNDPAYYLEFVIDKPKLAYATSMGTDQYTDDQLKCLASRIKDYQFVSVREKCSVGQLERAGIKNVHAVCDPTFLLRADDYSALAKSHKSLGKYVAVYLVEPSALLDKTLDSFRAQGYKIVGVAGYLNKYKCDIRLMDAGPAEFLGLIRDASFVVATSFHATVFSLIFHKQFAIIPGMNPARIEQLLSLVHLQDRMLTKETQIPNLKNKIEYAPVQEILDNYIENSSQLLLAAIDNAKENGCNENL